MLGRMKNSGIALLVVLLMLFVAACSTQPQSGQADQKKPIAEQTAQKDSLDSSSLVKEVTWNAYQQVLDDVRSNTFPIDSIEAKRIIGDKYDQFLIIDIRSQGDYQKKHVKGAINLSIAELAENIDRLPRDKTLILYCYTGQTSALAMVPLKAYGFKAIFINGGYSSIESTGFEMDDKAVAFTASQPIREPDANRVTALAGIKTNLIAIAKQHMVKTLVIDNSDVKEIVEGMPTKYAFVDLRPKEDYDKSHIDGAINAPLMDLRQRLSSLPKDRRLILCCKSGQLASMATAPLTAEGFKIISMCSGFAATEMAKFPMVKAY